MLTRANRRTVVEVHYESPIELTYSVSEVHEIWAG